MSELSVKDYIAILNGKKRGSHFSSNYYVIAREEKKKSTQKDILLEEGVGLPNNMNEEYEQKLPKRKRKKLIMMFYDIYQNYN